MDVSCVPVVRGFVVGNRPAGFAEAPVHDRVVGQDHISVGPRRPREYIPRNLFIAVCIVAGTDIPFAADGKSDCIQLFLFPPKSAFCVQALVAGSYSQKSL